MTCGPIAEPHLSTNSSHFNMDDTEDGELEPEPVVQPVEAEEGCIDDGEIPAPVISPKKESSSERQERQRRKKEKKEKKHKKEKKRKYSNDDDEDGETLIKKIKSSRQELSKPESTWIDVDDGEVEEGEERDDEVDDKSDSQTEDFIKSQRNASEKDEPRAERRQKSSSQDSGASDYRRSRPREDKGDRGERRRSSKHRSSRFSSRRSRSRSPREDKSRSSQSAEDEEYPEEKPWDGTTEPKTWDDARQWFDRRRRTIDWDPDQDPKFRPRRPKDDFITGANKIAVGDRTARVKPNRFHEDHDNPSSPPRKEETGDDYASKLTEYLTLQEREKILAKRHKKQENISRKYGDRSPERNHERRICKFFQQGFCKLGDQCTFAHEGSQKVEKIHEMCKYYMHGNCLKGDHCNLLHGQFPCRFHAIGKNCYHGNNCKFSHDPLTPFTQQLLDKQLQRVGHQQQLRNQNEAWHNRGGNDDRRRPWEDNAPGNPSNWNAPVKDEPQWNEDTDYRQTANQQWSSEGPRDTPWKAEPSEEPPWATPNNVPPNSFPPVRDPEELTNPLMRPPAPNANIPPPRFQDPRQPFRPPGNQMPPASQGQGMPPNFDPSRGPPPPMFGPPPGPGGSFNPMRGPPPQMGPPPGFRGPMPPNMQGPPPPMNGPPPGFNAGPPGRMMVPPPAMNVPPPNFQAPGMPMGGPPRPNFAPNMTSPNSQVPSDHSQERPQSIDQLIQIKTEPSDVPESSPANTRQDVNLRTPNRDTEGPRLKIERPSPSTINAQHDFNASSGATTPTTPSTPLLKGAQLIPTETLDPNIRDPRLSKCQLASSVYFECHLARPILGLPPGLSLQEGVTISCDELIPWYMPKRFEHLRPIKKEPISESQPQVIQQPPPPPPQRPSDPRKRSSSLQTPGLPNPSQLSPAQSRDPRAESVFSYNTGPPSPEISPALESRLKKVDEDDEFGTFGTNAEDENEITDANPSTDSSHSGNTPALAPFVPPTSLAGKLSDPREHRSKPSSSQSSASSRGKMSLNDYLKRRKQAPSADSNQVVEQSEKCDNSEDVQEGSNENGVETAPEPSVAPSIKDLFKAADPAASPFG